jgi:hypothetical protein
MAMLVQPRPKPQMQEVLRDPPPQSAGFSGAGPDQIKRMREIARELAAQGTDYSPVEHWTQGLARMAQGYVGGLEERRADEKEREGKKSAQEQLAAILAGGIGDDDQAAMLEYGSHPYANEGISAALLGRAFPKAEASPEAIRKYEFARSQGFPGTFMDFETQLRLAGAGYVPSPGDVAPPPASNQAPPSPAGQPVAPPSATPSPQRYQPIPGGPQDPANKPPPGNVQAAEDKDIEAIGANRSMNMTIDDVINRIDKGSLKLGAWKNLWHEGELLLGTSSPEAVEYSTFMQGMKKMQNDILILHNGVQTEGDAKRALQQIITNPTDEKSVKANLTELKKLNDRARVLRKQMLDIRRQRNRMAPLDPATLDIPDAAPQPEEFTPTDQPAPPSAPAQKPSGGVIQYDKSGKRVSSAAPAPAQSQPKPQVQPAAVRSAPSPAPAYPTDPYGLTDLKKRLLDHNARVDRERLEFEKRKRMLTR